MVTTFLQLLDADDSSSLFVAATNTGHALDAALFRRFDDVLELPQPTDVQRDELLNRLLRPWRLRVDAQGRAAASGLSYADIQAAVQDAHKDAVLDEQDRPTLDGVAARLQERRMRLRGV